MKIKVDVKGIDAAVARMAGLGKQVDFATAKALTQTAHAVNADIKEELKSGIQGGATAYTLRAFQVAAATKAKLESSVSLRDSAPSGGTNYTAALAHLFGGGRRRFKRMEGWLRGRGLLPAGMMVAPGRALPLDARGNIRRPALNEMLGVLKSQRRNLQVFRRPGKDGQTNASSFFVALPGDKSGRFPGVWRRQETGKGVRVDLWLMYVTPAAYRQQFDLHKTATKTVSRVFKPNFDKALAQALVSAK
jgi:hypothetical protein